MSKKIIIFMMSSFLLFSLLFISFFEPSHASGEINNSTNGLGKTINIVKDGYSEFDSLSTNHDVLNNEWLQSQLENVQSYDVTRTTEVISANSIEEYQNQFSMMINTENALGAEFNNIVFASIEKNFNFTGHLNYEDNISQFYYTIYSYLPLYGYRLPNHLDLSLFKNNLSQEYVGFLNLLFRNAITPDIFFDRFGTHLVSSAHYGGVMSFNYTATSNTIVLNGDVYLNLKNGLNANILDKLTAGTGFNFDSSLILNKSRSLYNEKFSIRSLGGSIFSTTSYEFFVNNYSTWVDSIDEDNAALIGLEPGGLIPLWDILPVQYQNKRQQFKNMCENYISNRSYTEGFNHNIDTEIIEHDCVEIRLTEILVEDGDRFENPYDIIDFSSFSKYGVEVLRNLGYTTLHFTLEIKIKEKNKGYQQFWIYSKYEDNDANILFVEDDYEAGGSALADEYILENFTINISIDKIETSYDGNFLYLLFGASGAFGDDWYNKDVILTNIEIS